MNNSRVVIFGFNKYALEIVQNVSKEFEHVDVYALEPDDSIEAPFEVLSFDLSDDWSDLEKRIDIQSSIVFCVLEESAQNIFLTISLRAHFENLFIIAIASDQESANKLKMAGADKVIAIVESTADMIADILEKPISSRVLENIMYGESALKIEQVKIKNVDYFQNRPIADIDWGRDRGIIILSLMHADMSHEFIYASKIKNRVVLEGDTLVVAGYQRDIEDFKKKIGSE